MRAGRIVAEGPPGTVVTEQLVREVFELGCRVAPDPMAGTPLVIPIATTVRIHPDDGLDTRCGRRSRTRREARGTARAR